MRDRGDLQAVGAGFLAVLGEGGVGVRGGGLAAVAAQHRHQVALHVHQLLHRPEAHLLAHARMCPSVITPDVLECVPDTSQSGKAFSMFPVSGRKQAV